MQSDPNQTADLSSAKELIERDLLHFVYEHADAQVFVIDESSLKVVSANQKAQRAVGRTMRELQKVILPELIPNLNGDRVRKLFAQIRTRKSKQASFQLSSQSSIFASVKVILHFVPSRRNSIVAFVSPHIDLLNVVAKAAIAEERLAVAIESLSDGFVLYDKDDRLVVCNQKYRDIYRESADAMVPGTTFRDIIQYGLERDQYVTGRLSKEEWLEQRMREHRNCNAVAEQRLSDGRWLRIEERQTSDGGRVGLRLDITHQKEQQEELRRLTRSDDLTGVLNRRGLNRRLQILSFGLNEGEKLAILHIDLDRFKAVNDVHGHDAGDFVLKKAADFLCGLEPEPAAVARVGGDEFVVAFAGVTDESKMLKTAFEIIEGLSKPREHQLQSLQIGASIGIAFATSDEADALQEKITASDIALCEAKRAGGNLAVLFKPQMRDDITKNLEMAKEIRRGLAADEFFPFFQPQMDTSTGKVVGFEALIRWRHPTLGLIPAFKFLEIAQRIGLTDRLDNLVMDKSCQAARALLDWGMSPVRVSINLSFAQVSDTKILDRLNWYMTKHGIGPDNLSIELLESTLLDDRASIIVNNIRNLIRAGFKVELDDFGTGHAAIATLRKIDVARIKVDRSLVQNIDSDRELQVITSALIELAKNLGVAALAEGVETKEEQDMLSSMGCFVAQGYLHAKPMPLEQVKTWLKDRGDISSAPPLQPA